MTYSDICELVKSACETLGCGFYQSYQKVSAAASPVCFLYHQKAESSLIPDINGKDCHLVETSHYEAQFHGEDNSLLAAAQGFVKLMGGCKGVFSVERSGISLSKTTGKPSVTVRFSAEEETLLPQGSAALPSPLLEVGDMYFAARPVTFSQDRYIPTVILAGGGCYTAEASLRPEKLRLECPVMTAQAMDIRERLFYDSNGSVLVYLEKSSLGSWKLENVTVKRSEGCVSRLEMQLER